MHRVLSVPGPKCELLATREPLDSLVPESGANAKVTVSPLPMEEDMRQRLTYFTKEAARLSLGTKTRFKPEMPQG